MNTDLLCAWQDHLLEKAKGILKEEGKLCPMLFVLTFDNLVEPSFARKLYEPELGTTLKAMANGSPITLVTPLVGMPVDVRLDAVLDCMSPGERAKLEVAVQCLPPPPADDQDMPKRALLSALMRAHHLDEMDVEALYIKHFLRKTAALAYCRVGEGYVRLRQESAMAMSGRLRDDAQAQECIMCSMESGKIGRMLTLPFLRTARDTGAVTGFEQVMETRDGIGGRFADLLPRDSEVAGGASGDARKGAS